MKDVREMAEGVMVRSEPILCLILSYVGEEEWVSKEVNLGSRK